MKKTILIIGANGMFGQDASQLFLDSGYNVLKAGRDNCDITNLLQIKNLLTQNEVDFVIHAAAYVEVDAAEANPDMAFLINAEGAKNVAVATQEKSIPLIYISSDYVFNGKKNAPYLINDKVDPINVYGASKLAGEENVRKENRLHYIVRTSWLYGKNGKNFVEMMINLSKTQKSIKVVNDQFGCPTWTFDLARGIKKLIENKLPFGTYHLCGSGVTSWFEFAKKIFEILKIQIEIIPVTSDEFSRQATRPKFSALENGDALRAWEVALTEYLSIKS